MSEENIKQGGSAKEAAEIALIELRPGVAALYSKEPVSGLETMSFDLLSKEAGNRITDGLSQGLNVASVGSQFVQTEAVLQGLIQLTPKTIADM